MDPDVVNHSQVGNVFMIGAGGIVAICLGAYFGRLPVMFWFMILALGTALWCTATETFESFMAARILNGFFSPVAEAVRDPPALSTFQQGPKKIRQINNVG